VAVLNLSCQDAEASVYSMAQCLSPIRLKTPDKPTPFRDVPCGKCAACMLKKRFEWSTRLQHELQYATSAAFITLTYSDEYFEKKHPIGSTINQLLMFEEVDQNIMVGIKEFDEYLKDRTSVKKKEMQDFLKRFRHHDKSPNIRYYAVGEYGEKSLRPHYHLLMFNFDYPNLEQNLLKSWSYGLFYIGSVTEASIHYVSGYVMTKQFSPNDDWCERSFALMSRKPGIGSAYLQDVAEHYINNPKPYLTMKGGYKVGMPRYYKDKLYTDEAKLQIQHDINKSLKPRTDEMYSRQIQNNNQMLNNFSKNKKI